VSGALARLREYFEDELFIRRANGLVPTAYAESLRGPVNRAISQINNEIFFARNFEPQTATRTFHISTSDLGEVVLIPNLIRMLEQHAPGCGLASIALPPRLLTEALAQGDVDLAIGYFPDLVANGIHEKLLANTPIACLARKGHPFIGRTIDLDTFQRAPQAVLSHESRKMNEFEALVAEQGLRRNVRAQLSSMTSLPSIIAATDLIAVAPAVMVTLFPGLMKVELPFQLPMLDLKMYWHHRAHRDPATKWLRSNVSKMAEGMAFQ